MKTKFFLMSAIGISILPISAIVSCSKSPTTAGPHNNSNEWKLINESIKKNGNIFEKSTKKIDIKNNISITSWKNVDEFISNVSQYVKISNWFVSLIKENKGIFNSIKRVNIGVTINSQDISVTLFLNESSSDKNIFTEKINDVLDKPFSYAKEITLDVKTNIQYFEKANDNDKDPYDQFNKSFDEFVKSPKNNINFLKRVFDTSSSLDDIVNNFEFFKVQKISKNSYSIELTLETYNKGWILKTKSNTNSNEFNYLPKVKTPSIVKPYKK